MTKRGMVFAVPVFLVLVTSACAIGRAPGPEPLSIEFGQDRFLTDTYLGSTPGSICGPPGFAPGGVEARAPLPDGSWFRVFTIGGENMGRETVILERGLDDAPAQLTMRLDGQAGIVRLDDAGRRVSWGMYHGWADWLRELGARARNLECSRVE